MKKHILLLCFILSAGLLQAANYGPRPAGFVTDRAGVLSLTLRSRLEELLTGVEAASGIEIAVVTTPSLDGQSVDGYANGLFTAWRIGKKGKDNGLLLLLGAKERKVWIETGYGLEEVLPDGRVGEILDRHFVPAARGGDFDRAFTDTVVGLVQVLQKSYGFSLESIPERSASPPSLFSRLLLILLLIVLFIVGRRHPWILMLILSGLLRGGGGGGFGGRGGGGFGGFGGGFSGGGGAGRSF